MSFPKKGKFFPAEDEYDESGMQAPHNRFASEVASALRRSLGDTRAGTKIVTAWTGANDKTVKNWFAGRYAPSGPHLIALARHSDQMLETFLTLAGREELMVVVKLAAAERAIAELLEAVRRLAVSDVSKGATASPG